MSTRTDAQRTLQQGLASLPSTSNKRDLKEQQLTKKQKNAHLQQQSNAPIAQTLRQMGKRLVFRPSMDQILNWPDMNENMLPKLLAMLCKTFQVHSSSPYFVAGINKVTEHLEKSRKSMACVFLCRKDMLCPEYAIWHLPYLCQETQLVLLPQQSKDRCLEAMRQWTFDDVKDPFVFGVLAHEHEHQTDCIWCDINVIAKSCIQPKANTNAYTPATIKYVATTAPLPKK